LKDARDVFAAVARLNDALGPVTILVNNAMWNGYGAASTAVRRDDRPHDRCRFQGCGVGLPSRARSDDAGGGRRDHQHRLAFGVLAMANGIM
jgi:hypothetical protein